MAIIQIPQVNTARHCIARRHLSYLWRLFISSLIITCHFYRLQTERGQAPWSWMEVNHIL